MRAQRLFLLVALLALGSQLPAASGRRKGEKSGGCPPDDGPCLSVPDQCMDDSQCPFHKKCCYRACFRQCLPRVFVKQGRCPKDRLYCLSPTQHLCHKDSDCSGPKRCCHAACGRDCRDPARGMA
uniref:WAP four-disulfide core domain protein 5 n=1 Tax=Loxodonta africana TaxID=9785 RepID=G3UB07_LOXAF